SLIPAFVSASSFLAVSRFFFSFYLLSSLFSILKPVATTLHSFVFSTLATFVKYSAKVTACMRVPLAFKYLA
ncbi:hypothetical protein, partial [Frederiksenia canicola]